MKQLSEYDVTFIKNSLPRAVYDALKTHPGVFLAGGFIRAKIAHEEVSDIDLFASTKESAKKLIDAIAGNGKVHETDNAYTFGGRGSLPVQVIHRWLFDTPQQCVESFDFTIARAAIWWDGLWQSTCDDRFYMDLAAKRLVYCSPSRNEDAGGSMLRLLKFHRRGYSAPLNSTSAVIARMLSGVNSDSSMWRGTEQNRADVITGLLREVDPMMANLDS